MTNRQGRYRAFLSYSRADAAVARRVQRKLESYVLPNRVRIDGLDPKADRRPLRPVFRDDDELVPGGLLPDRISRALASSDFLIVLCSPAAARSEWVDREVAAFLALGRADQVIAVVIDGEPDAKKRGLSPDLECLPRSLRARTDNAGEHFWVDWRRKGVSDRRLFIRLVAALLQLGSVDELIQRDRQRLRRQRLLTGVYTALGLVATAAVGVLLWGFGLANTEIQTQRFDRYFEAHLRGERLSFQEGLKDTPSKFPADESWSATVVDRQIGDLNGDGIKDALVKYASFQLCGNSICQDIFLGRPDGSFEQQSKRDDLWQWAQLSISAYSDIRIRPRKGQWSDIVGRVAGESGSNEIVSLWRYSQAHGTYLPLGHMFEDMIFCPLEGAEETAAEETDAGEPDLMGDDGKGMPVRYYAPYEGVEAFRSSVDNPKERLTIRDPWMWPDATVGVSEDGRWLMLWSRFEGISYAEVASPHREPVRCEAAEIRAAVSDEFEVSG